MLVSAFCRFLNITIAITITNTNTNTNTNIDIVVRFAVWHPAFIQQLDYLLSPRVNLPHFSIVTYTASGGDDYSDGDGDGDVIIVGCPKLRTALERCLVWLH